MEEKSCGEALQYLEALASAIPNQLPDLLARSAETDLSECGETGEGVRGGSGRQWKRNFQAIPPQAGGVLSGGSADAGWGGFGGEIERNQGPEGSDQSGGADSASAGGGGGGAVCGRSEEAADGGAAGGCEIEAEEHREDLDCVSGVC